MIEAFFTWVRLLWATLSENYHPIWDTLDILLVAVAVQTVHFVEELLT